MLNFSPTLVLNADYQPLSYYPLSLWSWQDSVKAVFLNRVNIVAEYDQVINSPNFSLKLPSVIALKEYISAKKDPAFTRFNVFLRDKFTCQYCGIRKKIKDLTFDHIIPRSHGGKTNWLNVVSACRSCNFKKGNKSLRNSGLKLRIKPHIPSDVILKNNGRLFPPNFLHETWMDFLYWDTELTKN
ncbi:HNH endonuclease [Alphaproteobacteria bacterium]|nr:HNH endonuclease [Alphaproteobacteria bacterium]